MKGSVYLGAVVTTLVLVACSGGGSPDTPVAHAPDASVVQPPGTANAGPNTSVCAGGAVAIGSVAKDGFSYSWSPTTGLNSASVAQPIANPAVTTQYQLTVTAPDGHQTTDSVLVEVVATPRATVTAPTRIERGWSTTITVDPEGGTPPYEVAWSSNCAGGRCIASPSASSTVVTPTGTSYFAVSVVDARGCRTSALTTVTVLDPLVASSTDQTICAGQSVAIGQPVTSGAPPYVYGWSSDLTCPSPNCLSDASLASPEVSPLRTTTFTEQVTDALGAIAHASATVHVLPDPGTAGEDQFVYPGTSAQLGPVPMVGGSYQWSCDRADCAISAADVAQPIVSPLRSTRYDLGASSGPGCLAPSSANVWVELGETSAPAEGDPAFPVTSALQVQFDQPVAVSSLNATNVQLTDAVSGAVVPTALSYDATRRILTVSVTATGKSTYAAGNDYTLTLLGGPNGVVSDDPLRANLFANDLTIDYTAGAADTTPPTVIFRAPPSGSTAIPINTAVEATFSEAVDPATVTTATFALNGPSGPVDGEVTYDFASHTATFVPSTPLATTASYTVAINGVTDLSGNVASGGWTFTTGPQTDSTPPTVVSVSPEDGSVGVPSTTRISVTFSEPVHAGSLGGIQVVDADSGAVYSGTVSYDAAHRTATLIPSATLPGSHHFQIRVSGAVDLADNAMAPFTSRFATLRTLFFDDFEHGTAQWSLPTDLAGVAWSLASNTSMGPLHSLTDSAGSMYAASDVSIAQTRAPIDVTGLSQVTLEFALRTRTESNGDFFYVDVSVDGGPWTEVDMPGTTVGWSGNGPWSRWTIPVSIPSGSNLSVRLRLQTNSRKNLDGVYVDDLLVQAP